MPDGFDSGVRKHSFDAMATDLDNSSSLSNSPTLRGSAQDSYTCWTADVGGSPEISKFSFSSPSEINWRPVDDIDTCNLFSEGESSAPPKATYLFSSEEVYKQSYIPPLVIGLHDIVGEKRLVPKEDGFMYCDPSVAPLQHVISNRGLFVSYDDPVLELELYLKEHAIRVFQEVPPISDIANGPYFRYIGDYYILRTQKTLSKTVWDGLSEDVKNVVVKRYVDTVVAPADDPIPGNRYSADNVRKWYDDGNILPLVILRQTFRSPKSRSLSPLDIAERSNYSPEVPSEDLTSGSSASFSQSDVDQRSESVYSQESVGEWATHDNNDSPSVCSEGDACDMYTIASGVFLPGEEDTNPCFKRVIRSSLNVPMGENENYGRTDADMQLLEVEADDGSLMFPFLYYEADGR